MQDKFTRRDALGLGVSAAALAATGGPAWSAIKAADVKAPDFKIESGAKLSMLRPVKFVQPDEDIFRANAKRFTDAADIVPNISEIVWLERDYFRLRAGPGAESLLQVARSDRADGALCLRQYEIRTQLTETVGIDAIH